MFSCQSDIGRLLGSLVLPLYLPEVLKNVGYVVHTVDLMLKVRYHELHTAHLRQE